MLDSLTKKRYNSNKYKPLERKPFILYLLMRQRRVLKKRNTDILILTNSKEKAHDSLILAAEIAKKGLIKKHFKAENVKILYSKNNCLVGPLNNPYCVQILLSVKEIKPEKPVRIGIRH